MAKGFCIWVCNIGKQFIQGNGYLESWLIWKEKGKGFGEIGKLVGEMVMENEKESWECKLQNSKGDDGDGELLSGILLLL